MYLKFLYRLQEWVPLTKTRKNIHIDVCNQTVFEVHPPRSPNFSPFDFYVWRHLKILAYSGLIENEETLHQRFFFFFMSVRPFLIAPGLAESCDNPWQTFPCVHWFKLRVFSAFVVNCGLVNNKNTTVIKLRTCTVNYYVQALRPIRGVEI